MGIVMESGSNRNSSRGLTAVRLANAAAPCLASTSGETSVRPNSGTRVTAGIGSWFADNVMFNESRSGR